MPVRAPDDARPGTDRCFISQSATGEKRLGFAEVHKCMYIDILLLKTKKHNTQIYISLEQLRMINMQRTSAIEYFCSLEQVCFSSPSLSESASILSYFNKLFLWRYDGEF